MRRLIRVIALLFTAMTCSVSATPRPAFSFKYGDRAVTGSESLQVDEHLKVTMVSVAYPQFNATEWVLWFENPSAEKSAILSEIRDGNFLVSLPPQPKKFPGDIALPGERAVVTMNGCVSGIDYATDDAASAREFAAVTRTFHPWRGKGNVFEISNGCARPSDRQAPFFEVTQGGQGAIIAIGWTGGWRAKFADGAEGVRVETGIARARFYLEPGEKLRTSRVLVMNYAQGEDGANKFRRLLRRHFSHVASRPGVREGLFAYELWGGLTSAEMIRRVNTLKAKGLAYEDLWIDAGWYGNSTKCDDAYTGDWGRWTGDWVPNARIHPKGLEDVRDAAKDAGMGIMLWFEPERVVGSSNFAKQHPDLLLGSLLYYGNENPGGLRGTAQFLLLPTGLQHGSRHDHEEPRRKGPRRHHADPPRHRALPDVGRAARPLSEPPHRQLRERRAAHRHRDHAPGDPVLPQRLPVRLQRERRRAPGPQRRHLAPHPLQRLLQPRRGLLERDLPEGGEGRLGGGEEVLRRIPSHPQVLPVRLLQPRQRDH